MGVGMIKEPLVQELVKNEAISATEAQAAQDQLQANLEQGKQALTGIRWTLNQSTGHLTAQRFPEEELLWELDLPDSGSGSFFDLNQWSAAGHHLALFNPETAKKVEDIPSEILSEISFIRSQQGLFIAGEHLKTHNLPLSDHFLSYVTPRQAQAHGPLDLFFSPSGEYLAIADRSAGDIHLIQLESGQLENSFSVRKAGSTRGLQINFDEQNKQLVIFDNTSSIGIWNYAGEQVRRLTPGAGLLGAGVIAEGQAFALSTKPSPGLKVIDLASGDLIKEIAIKGELLSVDSDAPIDLISLTPDSQQLLFMTYLNEPEPFTPIISVVDIKRKKTTQRFALKDGSRPALLSFVGINPLAEKNQTLIDFLMSKALIDADDLHQARVSLRERERQQIADEVKNAPLLDLEQRNFEEAQQREQEDDGEQVAESTAEGVPVFKPEKAPQLNISPAADDLITQKCVEALLKQSQGDIDLVSNEDLAEPYERVKSAANRARHELEWHTGAIIKLRQLVGDVNFEIVITREEMEQMLHRYERDTLVKTGMPTVPSNCPNCQKPLYGSYACSYCGYEIERPEDLLKRGLVSIASIRPLDNLPEGHFLLIDMEGKRIIEIDTERNIIWTMGKDMLAEGNIELEFPRDACRLATRNTLITDYSLNRVVEITPSGRIFWDYKPKNEEHLLKNPVRATANGLNQVLIVDQGRHRILEVNHDSEVLRQFGQTDKYGITDDLLYMPSDVQRLVNGNILITDTGNHRILELEDNKIVWQYGNPENRESGGYGSETGYLSYPQSAIRRDNGNTLIVDAGNLRILELDSEGEIVYEHKTNEGPEAHQLDSPFRVAYMPNGLMMVLSETAVIEVDVANNEVVWACRMSEFERVQVTLKPEQEIKRFITHGVKNPYLRHKADQADVSEEAQQRLQTLIKQRLGNHKANMNKAHITRFGKEDLDPLDFFLVDRSKNKVIRTDREGNLSWRYGEGEGQKLFKPHACTRTAEGYALIADTDQHRIIEVDPAKSVIVWSFGELNKPEKAERGLNRPRYAQILPNGHVLIVDQNNRRVFEMKKNRQIVWSYEGMEHLMAPYHAERLANGNTLITDWGAHQTFEVNPAGETVWSFGENKVSGDDASHLSYPESASRLDNGNTLIADSRNNRILEIAPDGSLAWELDGQDTVKFGSPSYARRLKNGRTQVLHTSNRQMFEVDSQFKLYWKLMLPFERSSSNDS